MKKYVSGFMVGLFFISAAAFAAITTDIITLGYGGVDRARIWVSENGRIGMQSHIDDDTTAIDLWPTSGTRPTNHSLSEITLQRKLWSGTGLERFNISAMTDPGYFNGAYRFGVEREGDGVHRDVIFCFEDVTPGVAVCPFKVTLDGVYISDDGGATWRVL